MARHVKEAPFKVKLSNDERRDLLKLVALEKDLRQDAQLGGATLLREYAMPRVRERLAELSQTSETDRRHPAGVASR
jgi:hypothetical protein